MRASYQKDLKIQDSYTLTGDSLHHLLNVVRVKPGEFLLLLDGKGLGVKTEIESITKKEIRLKGREVIKEPRRYQIDVALGMPKKEALDLCLKQAVELGIRKVFLIRSDFSQTKLPENERIQNILVSALEQSNSHYLPEIKAMKWDQLPFSEYATAYLMDSQTPLPLASPELKDQMASRLIIVGPEGGFSPGELEFLHARPNLTILNLPTPLLRTPTAMSTGIGMILRDFAGLMNL